MIYHNFITFEGGEGTGKTTQAKLLTKKLTEAGFRVLPTKEPGASEIGGEIRKILLYNEMNPGTELWLFMADRFDHVETLITPALKNGLIVICDRFSDSTKAYQMYGRGLFIENEAGFDALEMQCRRGIKPGLTILLDVDPEIGLSRKCQHGPTNEEITKFETEKLEFHTKIRKAFLKIAQKDQERSWLIVDTSNFSETETANQIWEGNRSLIGGVKEYFCIKESISSNLE